MKPRAARLILTVALFLGWLGYLGYLVVCRPHTPGGLRGAFEGRPLTLSRPQMLVSTLDVVAEVSGDKGEKVVVKEVLFPNPSDAPVKKGETIHVELIDQCHPLPDPLAKDANPPPDYTGPGDYLLPLQAVGSKEDRRFQVVPTPPSPGFFSAPHVSVGPPRIYPATDEMLAEYRSIAKP
ncbi:MAG TPA: hypothetical protein VMG10_12960 [Gemmataceae bacterium]|nr:hypothetical protein [Gemmataceae bacterium]